MDRRVIGLRRPIHVFLHLRYHVVRGDQAAVYLSREILFYGGL